MGKSWEYMQKYRAEGRGERAERQHSVLYGEAVREANESIETSGESAPKTSSDD